MVKEVGTGVLAAAGVGGTGYGIYYVMQPHTIEDLIVNDVISKTEENRKFGYPLTKASSDLWNKAYHRYELESDDSTYTNKKFDSVAGDNETAKIADFKRQCIELLKSSLSDEDLEGKKEKANLWCVTYETVEDKLDKKELEEVNDDKKDSWKSKYDTATGTGQPYKTKIEAINTSLSSISDETTRKATAMKQWCEKALHMSASKLDKVNGSNGNCLFKTAIA